jgi:BMFP domain-containing protein YqiC
VSHDALRGKIQEARIEYNTQLRNRFDGKLNHLDSGLTRPAL